MGAVISNGLMMIAICMLRIITFNNRTNLLSHEALSSSWLTLTRKAGFHFGTVAKFFSVPIKEPPKERVVHRTTNG